MDIPTCGSIYKEENGVTVDIPPSGSGKAQGKYRKENHQEKKEEEKEEKKKGKENKDK